MSAADASDKETASNAAEPQSEISTEEQLKFLEARKKEKEEARLRKEVEEKRSKILVSLQAKLDDCYTSLREVSLADGLPFGAKVLSKGENLTVCRSWHAEEAFLALGKIGPKLVQKMIEIEERINKSSDLSDNAKLLAIRLLKLYADFRELSEFHYSHGNYVLGLSNHEEFGEVLSFQRKKWRIYVYLDIGSYLSRKFDAWKQKMMAQRARGEEEEEYYKTKKD